MLFPVYFIFLTNCKKNIFFFFLVLAIFPSICLVFVNDWDLSLYLLHKYALVLKMPLSNVLFSFWDIWVFWVLFFFLIKDTGVSWILTKKTQTYLNCHSLFCFLILENLYLWYFPLLAVEEYSNWKGIAVDSQALYLYFLLTLVWLLCF